MGWQPKEWIFDKGCIKTMVGSKGPPRLVKTNNKMIKLIKYSMLRLR